jgi:hypothetical protein
VRPDFRLSSTRHLNNNAGRAFLGRELVVLARTPRTDERYEMVVRLFRHGDAVWLLQAIGPQARGPRG